MDVAPVADWAKKRRAAGEPPSEEEERKRVEPNPTGEEGEFSEIHYVPSLMVGYLGRGEWPGSKGQNGSPERVGEGLLRSPGGWRERSSGMVHDTPVQAKMS